MKNGFVSPEYVHIEGGLFAANRDRDLAYLRLLDADMMLYNFRAAFGVPVREKDAPGGWDAPNGLLRGHSTGHFMSALAIAVQTERDKALEAKLRYMVHELRALQLMSRGDPAAFTTACTPEDADQAKWSRDPSTWGEGFLSAYSPDQFALLEKFTPYAKIWAPYYTLHKILAGFIDAYERVGIDEALDAARGIASWVCRRLAPLPDEMRAKMWSMYIAGEYGGMNESLARLAIITGDGEYARGAKLFDNANIFPSLAESAKDETSDRAARVIAHLHANQHIPQLVGAALEYAATGEGHYLDAARAFWRTVTENYMYAIGGVGRGERFTEPGSLAANIDADHNCETCCAYNMLKLTARLYEREQRAEYIDYYERALYNQIAASQNPRVRRNAHNAVTYMLPIGPGARKQYSDDFRSFTCCHGTGMENHVKYGENIFYRDGADIKLNLYVGAHMSDGANDIRVESRFPLPGARITVSGEPCRLLLRVPGWAKNYRASYNGTPAPVDDGYAVITHGGNGTTAVSVTFDYEARFEFTPDRLDGSDVACVMYGPFVMVSKCPDGQDWQTLPRGTRFESEINTEAGAFALSGDGRLFIPMFAAHNCAYHTYFKIKD